MLASHLMHATAQGEPRPSFAASAVAPGRVIVSGQLLLPLIVHTRSNVGHRATSQYYVALDGLRAIAVLMVFCQHYGAVHAWIFGWGWAGVDIFFVLSGFLITGILFDSRDKPHRFRDFYMRRTLRIFPLYYAVWLAILLLTPVAHWRWDWHWALWPAYLGNYARFLFLYLPGDPYRFSRLTFGPTVQAWFHSPMNLYIGHFWSLCVEEQFYLIWPLIVYRVRRRESLMQICVAAVLAAPLLRWLLTQTVSTKMLHMELLYRSLPTRIDALLIGGLIALCLRGPEQEWLHRWRRWLLASTSVAFLCLYLVSTKLLRLPLEGSASNWIGIFGFTLIDLFAGALILECIHPGAPLNRLLSLAPLRGLGVISYGFYVYHDLFHDFYAWFANRFFPTHALAITIATALLGTLLIAQISFRLIEQPFLRLKDRFTSQTHRAPSS
jgi:peptidoglycan/LPS O-acetylase OafA/YrhL